MLASKGSPTAYYSLFVTLALVYLFYQNLLDRSNKNNGQRFCHDESSGVLEQPSNRLSLPTLRNPLDTASSIDCVAVRERNSSSSNVSSPPPPPSPSQVSSEPPNIYEDLKRYAVNNTVMMVPVNKGMLQYAENMLCSFHKINFNTQNMVFWTLDNEVGGFLKARGLNTFYDPALYGVADFVGVNGREHFEQMMMERPKFFINVLSTGLDILFLDTDIVFFDNPMVAMRDPSVDLVIGSDGRDFFGPEHNPFHDQDSKGQAVPPVCAGSFWMKSNEHTIALWEVMKLVFQGDPSVEYLREAGASDDQHAFDVLLNDRRARLVEPYPEGITAEMMDGREFSDAPIRVRMMDQAVFPSGHQYLEVGEGEDYLRALASLEEKGGRKLAIHFNWNGGSGTKIENAKKRGLWYLDGEKKCI